MFSINELRVASRHELMHVYNRDILTSPRRRSHGWPHHVGRAVLMFFWVLFTNDATRKADRDFSPRYEHPGSDARTLIQFTISRTREFDADETGELTQDPLPVRAASLKWRPTGAPWLTQTQRCQPT